MYILALLLVSLGFVEALKWTLSQYAVGINRAWKLSTIDKVELFSCIQNKVYLVGE